MLYSSIILTKFPKYWSTGFATSFATWNWKKSYTSYFGSCIYIFFCKEYYMRNMRDMNCIEKLHVSKNIHFLNFSLISLKRIKKECDIFQHLLCLSTAIFEPYEQLQSMDQVERKRMWVETCCLPPRTVNEFTTTCLIFTTFEQIQITQATKVQLDCWPSRRLQHHWVYCLSSAYSKTCFRF